MSNKVKDIDIKNRIYYFFNDIINIKNFDPNNIKMDEKSYKDILIYYIGYVKTKDSKYVKIYCVNPLYLIFSDVNGYFEEISGNKYLTLVPSNERKEKIKKYKELWTKIRDLIRSITENLDDYDEKYMKIKFHSDDELPPNKTIKIPKMIIVVGAVFHENNKYYPQVFLDEYLYKLQIKTSASKECDIYHYWYFLNYSFKFQQNVCNRCHDLLMMSMNFSDIAILKIAVLLA